MKDTTITLLVDDIHKPIIYEITHLLADANINIEEIYAEEIGQKGIINLTVEAHKIDIAVNLLKQENYFIVAYNNQLFEIDDKPGALAQLSKEFKDKNLSIKSMRFINRQAGKAIVSVAFE